MKTLYFLRHAKAEPGSKVVSDRDRTLAPRGREACETVGAFMKAKKYLPDLALASSSARTRETLERVSKAAGISSRTRFEDALYLASGEEIIRVIQGADDSAGALLVVGHNPGMHHSALLLSTPEQGQLRQTLELKYPTCALSVLHFTKKHWKDIAAGDGLLTDFITPEDLE